MLKLTDWAIAEKARITANEQKTILEYDGECQLKMNLKPSM